MASLSGASAALLAILTLLLARSMSTVAPASTALTALVTALTRWPQLMFSTCNWYIAMLLLGVDSVTVILPVVGRSSVIVGSGATEIQSLARSRLTSAQMPPA